MTNDIVSAEVSGLAFGGDFVGTVLDGNEERTGKKIFVPFAVPGEFIEAEITKEEKSLLKGSLIKILEPSKERTSPPCPIFGECGGCDLQHINIKAQRKFKEDMALSMLQRQAKLAPKEVISTSTTLPSFNYRNRISLHLNTAGEIGFFRKNSADVVDCSYCHITSELLNQNLSKIRKYTKELSNYAAIVVLEENNQSVYLLLKLRDEIGKFDQTRIPQSLKNDFPNFILMRGDKILFSQNESNYPAGHFSQVNEAGNKELIKIVLENTLGNNVLDLYAGDGNFSIPLSQKGKSVSAVEIDINLTKYAEEKIRNENLKVNLKFHTLSCEKYFKSNECPESIVLDPPRSGAKNISSYFNNQEIKEIIYVSCNLPGLCRDLKEISSFGYAFEKLYFVDMFPQTHHVELVAVLRRG